MGIVGGLGLPPPRQPQLLDVRRVTDVNPFSGPRPLMLDPLTGHITGRGAAMANLLARFHVRGLVNHSQLPSVHPLDVG